MAEQTARTTDTASLRRWTRFQASIGSSSPTIMQTTLKHPIHCRGIGLHAGQPVLMRLIPAKADTGIRFQRLDKAGSAPFRITPDRIISSPLATVAASPYQADLHVATIEHLMAALHASGIDNLLIQLDGPELPILDGCSQAFLFLLDSAGTAQLETPRRSIEVLRTVHVTGKNGAHARLLPGKAGQLEIALTIDFPAPAIGKQSHEITLSRQSFEQDVAFCRTFVNHQDIAPLQAQGLALGGSLENALVIQHDRILNPGGLRHSEECVRHKILDTIGDLYCAGYTLSCRYEGHKTGHALNNQLLRALFASPENWRFSDGSASSLPPSE